MKKTLVILAALCLALSLFGCGSASRRLIAENLPEVSRIHAAHFTPDPVPGSGTPQCDAKTDVTDRKTIASIVSDLHAYRLEQTSRPMNGSRMIELSFYSEDEMVLGKIWLDDEGVCASTYLANGNNLIRGALDFARWESLFSAAATGDAVMDEAIETISRLIPADEYGGCYLEGDKLVVNIAGEEAARAWAEKNPIDSDLDVEYRAVQYPLWVLENVKNFLTPYMGQYNITALDANEVTNRVDVSLYDYSDSTFEEINRLVGARFYARDLLTFIDMRGAVLEYTDG